MKEEDFEKKAEELERKLTATRNINIKLLKRKKVQKGKQKPFQKFLSVMLNILLGMLIFLAVILCADTASSAIQGVCPTFLGYSNMRVVSSSMTRSGFNVGDSLICHAVNTRTLHGGKYREGDVIAFYRDSSVEARFNLSTATLVENYPGKVQFDYSIGIMLNIRNEVMQKAGKKGAEIVFHHIKDVYMDANGEYWFKTYGSSNADPLVNEETVDTHVNKEVGSEITFGIDSWYVNEKLVVGVYDNSPMARVVSSVVGVASTGGGLLLLLIPIAIIAIILIRKFLKDIELFKLEMDILEEKRSITDDLCVINEVGFNMDEDVKLKVLSQAEESKWNAYITLLWPAKQTPKYIADYKSTREILLYATVRKLWLNRTCTERLRRGDNALDVAKFYYKEKEKLDQEQSIIDNAIKRLPKGFTLEELKAKLLQEKDNKNVATDK